MATSILVFRYIGITGYDIGVLKRIVSMLPPNTIDTVLSYCRYNLLNKGTISWF